MKNRKKRLLTALAVLAVMMVAVVRFRPVGFDALLPFPRDEVKYCYAVLVPHDPASSNSSFLEVDFPLDSPEYQGLLELLDSTSYIWSGLSGNSHAIRLENYSAHLYFRDENGLDNLFCMDFYGRDLVADFRTSWKDSNYYPLGGKEFQQAVVDYLVGCCEKVES